ncbi:MAG: cytochrome c biogenesis protein CcdA, partial [Candidatus Krumholzibacteria bacterium]|nr:cytochrome c biogenesis protein CcdA [Candidatus Krumholzibacteria bacterium]
MLRFRAFRLDGVLTAMLLAIFAILPAPHAASAQGFGFPGTALVTTDMKHSLSVFHPGAVGYVAITAKIADGWHINSNKPLESFLIPSELVVNAPAGIEIVRLLYPTPALRRLEMSNTAMSLYDGVVVFGAVVRIGENVVPGSYRITAALRYQGCNDMTCVEPSSASADDTLRVGTMGEAVEQLDAELFAGPPFSEDRNRPTDPEDAESGSWDLGKMIAERGLAIAFLSIFLLGLALSLTPCIYPLIPITISYFGGQAEGKTRRVFLLAVLYVFGMSITYSVLGTIAAVTGSLFGAALQNPFVMLFLAAVLVALALSMFGLWEIRMPMFLARRTGTARQGYAGAILMGLTMGIIAAPCIGPAVLALLTYVGEMGKPLMGFLMFFTLA